MVANAFATRKLASAIGILVCCATRRDTYCKSFADNADAVELVAKILMTYAMFDELFATTLD